MPIRFAHWISGVFDLNGLRRFLKKEIPEVKKVAINIGIVAMEAYKFVMDNPIVNIYDEMAKRGLLKDVIDKARIWLPEVIAKAKLTVQCADATGDDLVKCGATLLQSFEGDFKSQQYTALAEQFAVASTDGKISWDEIAGLVRLVYDHDYKPKQAGENTEPTDDEPAS